MRKKIATAKSLGMVVQSKDHVPSLDSSLNEMKDWTRRRAIDLYDQVQHFKDQILYLCQNNLYLEWIRTTGQKELALEWGVSQPTVSRLVGDLQKEYRNEIKEQANALFNEGKSIREIVEILPIDVDERTVRRWIKNSDSNIIDASPSSSKNDDTPYLKIQSLEKQLIAEKDKSARYQKEMRGLKNDVKKWKGLYEELRTKYSHE